MPASRWALGLISPYDVQSSEHDRPTNPKSLERLEAWDEDLLEPITLAVRASGDLVRVAGKHRCLKCIEHIEAGRLPVDYRLPFYLLQMDRPEDESLLVAAMEKARRASAWTVGDFWHERKISDPRARDLDRRVRACGFEIIDGKKCENRRQIMAISTLERVDRHPGLLAVTLDFIRECWADEPRSNDAVTLEGVARFFYCHQGAKAWDAERIQQRLRGKENLHLVKIQAKLADASVRDNAGRFAFGMRAVYNLPVRKGGVKLVPEREWTLKPKP